MSFAANGITAEGAKAFDRVLQSNISLKTLNISGNPIGDEGAKVSSSLPFFFNNFANRKVIWMLDILLPLEKNIS